MVLVVLVVFAVFVVLVIFGRAPLGHAYQFPLVYPLAPGENEKARLYPFSPATVGRKSCDSHLGRPRDAENTQKENTES
jgi:hypothetical protein